MRWGQCTLQDLRCRERPRIPRPAADKPGGKERQRGSRSERDWGYCFGDDSPGFFAEGIMQFAIWLVGLMCHLSAFVRETLQYQLHPKQGSVFFWLRWSDTAEMCFNIINGDWAWFPACGRLVTLHLHLVCYTGSRLFVTIALSLTSNFLWLFLSRKLHQAAVIVWNRQAATCEWLRRVVPPQTALQKETAEFKQWPVRFTASLQDWCFRGTLSSQSNRRLQLYRALLHGDTLGRGAEQRHGLPVHWPRRYAPLLFPWTRQRQERVPCRLQPVHWSGEYLVSTPLSSSFFFGKL